MVEKRRQDVRRLRGEFAEIGFNEAEKFVRDNLSKIPEVRELIEALEKCKLEFETINSKGHQHMFAWQVVNFEDLKG